MKGIFSPGRVAVIGVSAKPENLGRNIMLNLIDFGFDGVAYPVGPNGGAITTRRIYKSLADIPDASSIVFEYKCCVLFSVPIA